MPIEKYQTYVDLIFLNICENVSQIFVHSVTVDVFNSNVLLLGGPCMELRILSSLTGNIYFFSANCQGILRHFVKSVRKGLKNLNLCFCVIEAQNISCQGPPKSSVFGCRPPSENM